MDTPFTYLVARALGDPDGTFADLDDAALEDFTISLENHRRSLDALFIHTVGELDRRRVADRTWALSTRQWLRRFCRQTGSVAGATLQVARRLVTMPNVAKRAMAGEIPSPSLHMIATAQRRHPEAFALHEETFADIAASLDAHDMRRALDHWEQQVDHAGALDDIARRRDRRRLGISQTLDGMWHVEGLLDPEAGHVVATTLRSHADRGNLDPHDRRPGAQRLADALTDVCRRALDASRAGAGSGGIKPHITVVATIDQLRGGGELPTLDGTPVSHEDIRRLACDAGLVGMVVGDAGQPLDVGRTVRSVPSGMRRALDLRDGGCSWRGCDAPAHWCDAHHIVHWADGGSTSLTNLRLLCRRHHTAVHEGGNPDVGRRAPPDR
jgi:Domain of unknown function (DUF222)/HNH endonuclease